MPADSVLTIVQPVTRLAVNPIENADLPRMIFESGDHG